LVLGADVAGIVINAPDVTRDLNGFTVRSEASGSANSIEVPSISNVEIRNGSVNDIPVHAISAIGGSGLRLIDIRVTTAGKSGVYSTAGLTTVDRSMFSHCGEFGVYVFRQFDGPSFVTNTISHQNGHSGESTTARANVVSENWIDVFYVNGASCVVESNSIAQTLNGAGNANAICSNFYAIGESLYLNHRISPIGNQVQGDIVNGGGNITFREAPGLI
jgi:hypothetical protein